MAKRLYRSRKNRIIAGVCGGLGDYFDVDPVIIRVIFIGFLLAVGSTLLIYIVLWLITPNGPNSDTLQSPKTE